MEPGKGVSRSSESTRSGGSITYSLKFVLAGSSNVGKTALYRRFMNKGYVPDSASTVGMEFSTRDMLFERTIIKAQVWDTAGQERFDSMTKYYYRDCVGAFLIYDVCCRDSFEQARTVWLKQLRDFIGLDIPIALLGNKLDELEDEPQKREVPTEEALQFAQSEQLDFIEVSARMCDHVEAAFRRVVLSAAAMFPEIQEYLQLTSLPPGWLTIPNPSPGETNSVHYCNYWTGEMQAESPVTSARSPMLLTVNRQTVFPTYTSSKDQTKSNRASSSTVGVGNAAATPGKSSLSGITTGGSPGSDVDGIKLTKKASCCAIL